MLTYSSGCGKTFRRYSDWALCRTSQFPVHHLFRRHRMNQFWRVCHYVRKLFPLFRTPRIALRIHPTSICHNDVLNRLIGYKCTEKLIVRGQNEIYKNTMWVNATFLCYVEYMCSSAAQGAVFNPQFSNRCGIHVLDNNPLWNALPIMHCGNGTKPVLCSTVVTRCPFRRGRP